ncbi:MAG: hypothetical protein IT423_11580 [Pirellulaceae bacterium]|nr:hypothetical protein [Pirellulaceae bacterium]
MLSVSLQRQLPTIRSRCQVVRFQPLNPDQLAELIMRQGIADSLEKALYISRQCDGGLGMARTLADDELALFRAQLLERLSTAQLDFVDLGKSVGALADAAGKETIVRRPRTKLMLKMTADFYRELACQLQGGPQASDSALQHAISSRISNWPGGVEAAIECWNRCLEAIAHVDRNANQTALLEAWTSHLASSGRC